MLLTQLVVLAGLLGFLRFLWYLYRIVYPLVAKPKDLKKLGVNWAVVTGASGGVGHHLAVTLAKQGVNVAGIGRNERDLDELGEKVRANGAEFEKIVVDFADTGAAEQVFKKLQGREVGALFVCHGACPVKSFDKFTPEEIISYNHAMITSNVLLAKHFMEQVGNFGTITYVSSANTFLYTPLAANYGSVKRFVNQFGHMFRIESKHVTVQVINPGHIAGTKFFDDVPEAVKFLTKDPPGTLTPEKVTNAILATVGLNCDVDIGWDCILYRCLLWVLPVPVMDFVMEKMAIRMTSLL